MKVLDIPLCIYCGKPVDTAMPHWFGAHFEGEPMPYWHLECDKKLEPQVPGRDYDDRCDTENPEA